MVKYAARSAGVVAGRADEQIVVAFLSRRRRRLGAFAIALVDEPRTMTSECRGPLAVIGPGAAAGPR
jgi:hypothetical protein